MTSALLQKPSTESVRLVTIRYKVNSVAVRTSPPRHFFKIMCVMYNYVRHTPSSTAVPHQRDLLISYANIRKHVHPGINLPVIAGPCCPSFALTKTLYLFSPRSTRILHPHHLQLIFSFSRLHTSSSNSLRYFHLFPNCIVLAKYLLALTTPFCAVYFRIMALSFGVYL